MSTKVSLGDLSRMKKKGEKIAMVTAYDAPSARLADAAGVDCLLVGDSAAMTVLGHDSTLAVTMDEMLMLTRAVARGARRPVIVADMPFGSFQVSTERALENAVRFVKEGGADAVKLEGAGPMLARVAAIVGAGVAVMGHIGLTPQSATLLGGYKPQGRTAETAERLVDQAHALEDAGCFAVVLEAIPEPVARQITAARFEGDSDDRDRRRGGVRRPGAGLARPARPFGWSRAPIREAIRRSRRHHPQRAQDVRRRRSQPDVPRGAAHVRDARCGTGAPQGANVREEVIAPPQPFA